MNLKLIENYSQEKMKNEFSGHDFYHVIRVRNVAIELGKLENNCDLIVVEAASLLHDVADPRLCNNIVETIEEMKLKLIEANFDENRISHIFNIINNMSFKGAKVNTNMETIEGKVVQDADRLDAIGAIGIARCFTFSGSRNRLMWDPNEIPILHSNEISYRSSQSSALAHFDEKLLLLKEMMQTTNGKKIAEIRHLQLIEFKNNFIEQWNGDDVKNLLN